MDYSKGFLDVLSDLGIALSQVTEEVSINGDVGHLDPAAGDSLAPALERRIVNLEQLTRLSGVSEQEAPVVTPFAVTAFAIGKLAIGNQKTLIVRGADNLPVLLIVDRMILAQGGHIRSESPTVFNIQTTTRGN